MTWIGAEVCNRITPQYVPHCFIRDQQKVTQLFYQISIACVFVLLFSLVHVQPVQKDECRKRQAVCFYDLIFVRGHLKVMSSHFQSLDCRGNSVQLGKMKVVCSDGCLAANIAGDDSTTLFVSVTV